MEASYKSYKSNSRYIVSGEKRRAYLIVEGEAATNPEVRKQCEQVRQGCYDFATADWMARQLSNTY